MNFLVIAANEVSNCSSNKHTHKWLVQAIHLHHLQLEIDICQCNRKATIKISESERNPHKLYFCYTNCKFFEWYEGPEEEKVSNKRDRRHLSM